MSSTAMRVYLSAAPNPDFSINSYRGRVRISQEYRIVSSYAEASRVCRDYIVENELGGGNWTGGQILDGAGHAVAHVSYNGRVWEGEAGSWTPETREILI